MKQQIITKDQFKNWSADKLLNHLNYISTQERTEQNIAIEEILLDMLWLERKEDKTKTQEIIKEVQDKFGKEIK